MDPFLAIEIPVIIFAIVIHESAHGWMAEKCGDSTARLAGRITLNPIPHIDPFGTVILPILLAVTKAPIFGYAKPVPINYYNLRKPKRDMALVGMAGPLVNILVAFLSLLILKFLWQFNISKYAGVTELFVFSFQINLILAAFNLIPIPPFDGSRVISAILPDNLADIYNKIEPYGMIVILVLLSLHVLDKIYYPIFIFLEKIMQYIIF